MNQRNCSIVIQFLTAYLLICLVNATWAQNVSTEFQKTREDFLKALGKKPTSTVRTKGLQPKGFVKKGPEEVVPDNYEKLVQNPIARSLILFDFDSDRVKEESYPTLRSLAEVLQNDLLDAKLVVAGHTDSVGTDKYNMGLSKRRAQAVKHFLVSAYEIDADRLLLKWYGERQPFIQENTGDGRNRRVEFIRVE